MYIYIFELSHFLLSSLSLFVFPSLSFFLLPHSPSDIINTTSHRDENIHPVPIEDRIKSELPYLSNVMVVGHKRKYLTCLMTLKVYVYLPLPFHLYPPWNNTVSIVVLYHDANATTHIPQCSKLFHLLLHFNHSFVIVTFIHLHHLCTCLLTTAMSWL